MSKSKKIDINQMVLDALDLAAKDAIRTNTYLVLYEKGKVVKIKPDLDYLHAFIEKSRLNMKKEKI